MRWLQGTEGTEVTGCNFERLDGQVRIRRVAVSLNTIMYLPSHIIITIQAPLRARSGVGLYRKE